MSQEKKFDEGANNLLDVHIKALDENSKKVVEILEKLSQAKLSPKDKRALKRIKSEYNGVDKKLDSFLKVEDRPVMKKQKTVYLEDIEEVKKEEDDWFAF